MTEKLKKIFDTAVNAVFALILAFLVLGMALGAVQLTFNLWDLLQFKGVTGQYINIVSDVLTLFILVELSRSLIDYFSTHRLRLTFIVDAAIVFVIREILILLFKQEFTPDYFYGFSLLLFVLGALRTSSVLLFHREQLILNTIDGPRNPQSPKRN